MIVESQVEMAGIAADAIESLLASVEAPTLGLATGSSPVPVYADLIERHRTRGLSFAGTTMFLFDEYVGLPVGHPQSFRTFIRDAFTAQVTKPFADICVVAHVDEDTGKLVAELPDGEWLPQSVLEELSCNAKFTGIVYDRRGRPIWRAHSVRRATDAQRQLLIARDGGCFACGAHPDICDAHHVRPVSQGGATSLDNMVLACWRCHHKIHYYGWQICGPPGRRTLHPPQAETYGPAHAPERPSLFCPESTSAPDQARLLEPV